MRLEFIPKTILGRWSVGLIIVMPVFFYIGFSFVGFYESVLAGKTILQDIILRPGVSLPMLIGMVLGVLSFITGLVSIIRKKEHTLLAYAATMIGGLLTLFLLGEIFLPH